MPTYKLISFNVRGRVEISRYIMAVGGIEYEDCRVEKEAFMKMKPTLPFKGGLPVLEVDGVKFSQSIPIAKYLANEAGLAGKTALEQLRADGIVVQLAEALDPLRRAIVHEPNPDVQRQKMEMLKQTSLPVLFGSLEEMVNEHGFLVGREMTYADLDLLVAVELLADAGMKGFVDRYPKVKALAGYMAVNPKIAEWQQKRPMSIA